MTERIRALPRLIIATAVGNPKGNNLNGRPIFSNREHLRNVLMMIDHRHGAATEPNVEGKGYVWRLPRSPPRSAGVGQPSWLDHRCRAVPGSGDWRSDVGLLLD